MSNALLKSKPRRGLTVRDLLVLIVATAIGLAWMRASWNSMAFHDPYQFRRLSGRGSRISHGALGLLIQNMWEVRRMCPLLTSLTIGVVLLRFASPHSRLIRLARQPGTVACAVASAAVVFHVLIGWLEMIGLDLVERHRPGFHVIDLYSLFRYPGDLASAVVAFAWLQLWISGRWKNERDWIDRLGIMLGLYWLITAPLSWLVLWLDILVDYTSRGLW